MDISQELCFYSEDENLFARGEWKFVFFWDNFRCIWDRSFQVTRPAFSGTFVFFFPRDPLDLKLTMQDTWRLATPMSQARFSVGSFWIKKNNTGHGCPWLANGGGTGAQKSDKLVLTSPLNVPLQNGKHNGHFSTHFINHKKVMQLCRSRMAFNHEWTLKRVYDAFYSFFWKWNGPYLYR